MLMSLLLLVNCIFIPCILECEQSKVFGIIICARMIQGWTQPSSVTNYNKKLLTVWIKSKIFTLYRRLNLNSFTTFWGANFIGPLWIIAELLNRIFPTTTIQRDHTCMWRANCSKMFSVPSGSVANSCIPGSNRMKNNKTNNKNSLLIQRQRKKLQAVYVSIKW